MKLLSNIKEDLMLKAFGAKTIISFLMISLQRDMVDKIETLLH